MTQSALTKTYEAALAALAENAYPRAAALFETVLSQSAPNKNQPATQVIRLDALRHYGHILHLLGRSHDALATYEQLYDESPDDKCRVDAYCLMGGQKYHTGSSQESLELFQKGLKLAEKINYTAGRAEALGGVGGNLRYQGRTEEAINILTQAFSLYEQLKDAKGQINSAIRIGFAYYTQGALDKTIRALEPALKLCREHEMADRLIMVLNNLGECYQYLYGLEQALNYHREALALAQKMELRHFQTDTARNLGVDLLYMGETTEAIRYLEMALENSEAIGDGDIMCQTLFSLSQAEILHGDREKGHQYALRLEKAARAGKSDVYQTQALYVRGLYQQKQGNVDLAQEQWQQALFIAHDSSHRRILWQIHAGLADSAATPELTAVHRQIATEIIQQIAYPITDAALCETFLNAPPIQAILNLLISLPGVRFAQNYTSPLSQPRQTYHLPGSHLPLADRRE